MSKEILNSETVSDVEFILSLYPHLLIDKVSWHPNGTMSVILRISILATVARLACHASDANCDFRIWPVGHNGPIPSDLDNSSRKGAIFAARIVKVRRNWAIMSHWPNPKVAIRVRCVASEPRNCRKN